MKRLIRLFLIPTLLPLILIIGISSINNDKKITLQLLLWETPKLTLGTYLIITSFTGFIIGAFPSTLLSSNFLIKKRRVVYKTISPIDQEVEDDSE